MTREGRRAAASWVRRTVRRIAHAVGAPANRGPTEPCPVCGRPIRIWRPTHGMIALQLHPQELIQACRDQNGTHHTAAELAQALERRRRDGPQTYTQTMADLEEKLRRE